MDLAALPVLANVAVFGAGSLVVWLSGTRLSYYADLLAEKTGLGRAYLGVLLLGGITSLPEVAATTTAALSQNAPLTVNILLGGVMLQTVILALADILVGREALSSIGILSAELLEGVLLICALALVGCGLAFSTTSFAEYGRMWTIGVLALVLAGLFIIKRYESSPRWQPVGVSISSDDAPHKTPKASLPLFTIINWICLLAIVILLAGSAITIAADALAVQTQLGASFVGVALVAASTSLPEVSVTVGALRLGESRMAISNIFGTNLFDVALLAVADMLYSGPPILNDVGPIAIVSALMGILLTAVYVAGIIERRNRTILRMGWDSAIVLVVYILGMIAIYSIR